MAKVAEIDPDVRVTWNAYRERWQVWAPKPSLRNPISQGWLFLFPVQYDDGSYAPLDERTLSKLYQVSAQVWGSAKAYFNRIEEEKARDKERYVAKRRDSINKGAGEYFDFTQPKISMCGPSSGSKCAQLDEDLV